MHLAELAQVALRNPLAHDLVSLEAERAGHDLGHEMRALLGGPQHATCLGSVHAHPCLGEHMLAGFQCRQRDRAMQIRPGADDDRINVRARHHLLPVVVDVEPAVLPGDGGAGLGAAVAHSHDLDVRAGA